MATHRLQSEYLERRRRELGISRPVLAQRSGVSLPTVTRILTGDLNHTSVANVRTVAAALGVELAVEATTDSHELREREALAKATKIVRLVQGSSGLEAQAVDPVAYQRMINQTTHELMAGSRRRIWAPM